MAPVMHPFMTRPVELRLRVPGEPDPYGDPTVTWSSVSTVCEFQQVTTDEIRDGTLVAVTEWRLFLPGDVAAPTAGDECLVDGVTYAVDGDAWAVRDPMTGTVSHVECSLRKAV